MTVKIISAPKQSLTFEELVQGDAYRNVDGTIVIRTDETGVMRLDNGYLACSGHFDRDIFYPVVLEVRVLE